MSFVDVFNQLDLAEWEDRIESSTQEDVEQVLRSGASGLAVLAPLLSPAAEALLESLSLRSQGITRQRFGKVIRMFAPLYLSNECINNCSYCGFSRDNPILRVTLSVEETRREAEALVRQGFRNLLLVAGEHPRFVSGGYLKSCLESLRDLVPGLSLEVGPMEGNEYREMVAAGAEGLVVYQETYDREVYRNMHTAGPKKDFDWRLETPERAYGAGFRRLGIGALFGLAAWRREAVSVGAHVDYLMRHCWKSQVTVAFPRLRPCAGEFQPLTSLEDRSLAQLLAAFRIAFPDVGLVLSTREPARLRDGLLPLGVTLMSAGSHTEPGGYTGAGSDKVHRTERGRPQTSFSKMEHSANGTGPTQATGQFEIADERAPREIAEVIRRLGYEPVWKDWDAALTA